jgi:hypothetical protein
MMQMLSLEPMQIKKGMEKEWDRFRMTNSKDAYSCQVLCATMYFGQVLDTGNTPDDAEKFIEGLGLSISQANFVMQHIWHFHPRGEEVRKWWNKKYDQSDDAKGIVVSNMLSVPIEEGLK